MTDFYSVLKTSIIRRDLRSRADRHEVYDQAREAMIRRLWSFDPPLSEDEIDARIGLFDGAVEKIEGDIEQSTADAHPSDRQHRAPRDARLRRDRQTQPPREPLVYEGYDEDTDYTPALSEPPTPARYEEARPISASRIAIDRAPPPLPSRQVARQTSPERSRANGLYREDNAQDTGHETPTDEWRIAEPYDTPAPEPRPRSFGNEPDRIQAVSRALRYDQDTGREQPHAPPDWRDDRGPGMSNQLPATLDVAVDNDAYDQSEYEYENSSEFAYTEEAYREPSSQFEDYHHDDYDDIDDRRPPPRTKRRKAPNNSQRRRKEASHEAFYDDALDTRGTRHAAPDRTSGRRGAGERPRQSGGNLVRNLMIGVGVLGAILIIFIAYVILPIIFGSNSSPTPSTIPATSSPKIDDRLPAAGTPAAARIVSNSATAIEIPERNLNVQESLVIFNGSDPTVFEGSSNNPIQFDSDSEGGFARISSATSAAGARAIIGPGLAQRFAGHTIRVTILARSSSENGAATMRFAYQSGLAISHWQNADLSSNYGPYGMIWRVPATHSSAGDYLLIEPGIPGDGTSTDIRSIRVDIIAP